MSRAVPSLKPRTRGLLAGLAHAVLMALAFPPFSFWPAALVAIWPLAWLATRPGLRAAHAGLWAAIGASAFWFWAENFLVGVTWPGFLPVVALMAAYPGLFVWLVAGARARSPWMPVALTVPVAWVALEVVRGEVVFDGYAWYLIGHPLIDGLAGWLAMPGAVGGQYLVSLLVAALAGLVWHARAGGSRRWAVMGLVVLGAAWAGLAVVGERSLRDSGQGGTIRVGVVQTNLSSSNKEVWPPERQVADFIRFAELTEEAARLGADLIVWPETMKPGLSLDAESDRVEREAGLAYHVPDGRGGTRQIAATAFTDELLALQADLGVPLIVGENSFEGLSLPLNDDGTVEVKYARRFNSAFLLIEGRVWPERYDKLHTMAFGERMPGIDRWPWLRRQLEFVGAGNMTLDLSAGARPVIFTVPTVGAAGGTVRVATPICFEATVSDVCRRLVFEGDRRRTDLMVQLTNDGWFMWSDAGREAHLLTSRWRCLELGTPMVRAANTGVSAVIDARGRVRARGVGGDPRGYRVDGVLVASVPLNEGCTPAAVLGRLVGWVVLTAGGALALAALFARRQGKAEPGEAS